MSQSDNNNNQRKNQNKKEENGKRIKSDTSGKLQSNGNRVSTLRGLAGAARKAADVDMVVPNPRTPVAPAKPSKLSVHELPLPKQAVAPSPRRTADRPHQRVAAEAPKMSSSHGADVEAAWHKLESHANPYYATLHDPFNVGGVRIPDSVNYPSATFSIVKRVTLTASSNGVAAIGLGWFANSTSTVNEAHLIPIPPTYTGGLAYVMGQVSGTGASSTDIFGVTAVGYVNGPHILTFSQWDNSTLSVPGLFSQVRLVSAGLAVNSTASLTTLKGVWRAAFAPPDYYNTRVGSSTSVTFDEIGALPDSVEAPVNTGAGVTVTYSPFDLSSLDYCQVRPNLDAAVAASEADRGTMFVAVSGANAGDALVCTMTFNYEGIPLQNTMGFITTQPSYDDPLMISSALNRREEDPTAFTGTSYAKKSEHVSHPNHVADDEDRVVHHDKIMVASKKSSNSKVVQTEEREQEGFLEGIFKTLIPLIEGGAQALIKSI